MLKTYEYRLYPTKEQEILLAKHFGCVRLVYNKALELKERLWNEEKKGITCFELIKEITKWKQTEEYSFLYEVSNKALQQAIRHLDKAYVNFFKEFKRNGNKIKYKEKSLKRKDKNPDYRFNRNDVEYLPRFKNKKSKQSYTVIESCHVDDDQIRIPKFQDGIKARITKSFEGTIKHCTIKKTATGKYFVTVLVEDGKLLPNKKEITPETTVGIDLGINALATCSNDYVLENQRFFKKAEDKIKALQRIAAQKKEGSNRQKKIYDSISRVHEKVANRRKDYLHKFTSKLINDNQINTICLEDLNVKGMMKNHKLAKSISDVAWHELVRQLTYKAEWNGKNILFVDRFYPSSRTCNKCSYINKDLKQEDISWVCPHSGQTHDRDFNASLNIRDEALRNYFTGLGKPLSHTEDSNRTKCGGLTVRKGERNE